MTSQTEIKPRGVRLEDWIPLKDGDELEVLEGSSHLYTSYGSILVIRIHHVYGPEIANNGFNGYDLVCRLKKRSQAKPKSISAFIRKVESEYAK